MATKLSAAVDELYEIQLVHSSDSSNKGSTSRTQCDVLGILAVAFESATVTEDCLDNRCGSLHLLYAGLLNWMKRCGVDDLPSET